MRYFIIVNPTSGRGLGEKSIPAIESFFHSSGLEFTLRRTERTWHAAELAEEAARQGYEAIVCASGDGTINEAINGLMKARAAGFSPVFGVLSIGTGNDFAGSLSIPTTLSDSLNALMNGQRRSIDLGLVTGGDYPQGRYFCNGVGLGFDAAVGFAALQVRFVRGLPAYLIGVLQTVFLYYQAPRLRLRIDEETLELDSLMVSVMNGQRMGGGFRMAPNSQIDDGLFDLCIAKTAGKLRILSLIPHFIRGTQATQPEVSTRRARKIQITALQGDFPAHADGETLCRSAKTMQISLLPAALEVLCPR